MIDALKEAYLETEGWIKERMGDVGGNLNEGVTDVMTMEDVAGWKEKVQRL